MNNSVVSAAIIEGNLIIGLSDGSVINCGFVQGPQGLSGPQGPMGATGDNGTDGNTILTVGGTPGNEMGSDGDYAIDNINWRIYGPKSGGVWGKAKSMLPDAESMITNGRMPGTGSGGGSMGGSGSGSGGGTVFTNTVQLTAVTRAELINKTGYRVLPLPGAGKTNQEDANRWAFGDVFDRIDETIPVKIASGTPTAEYVGQLYFDTTSSTLFLWDGTLWNPIGGGSNSIGGGISAGDTVNGLWSFTTNTVQPGEWRFIDGSNAYDGGIQIEISDTDSQSDSYPIEYFKIGSQLQLRNVDQTGEFLNTGELNGVLTAVTLDSPDTYRLTYTIEGATGTAIDFARVRVAIAITVEDLDDRYVNKKGGDTMEGQLIINGPRKAGDDVDNPKLVSSLKVLSIDNAQNSSLQLRHSGNAKVYVGDADISIASDIKFNRAAGSVVKSNVQDLLNIGNQEIAYLGRSIEDEDLITKKYVDDTKDFLQNEIIELEEEIDAIAPSLERGKWTFTAVGTVGQPGQFTMYDADFGNGNPTGLFKSAKSVWFNEIDSEGTSHAFGDVDDGELLEIFIDGSPEFGLFEVVGKAHDETDGASSFWVVDVNFIRTNEATTAVGPGELCRFKIFMAPTGGDASSFVMKTGDTMTGKLQLDNPRHFNENGNGFTIKGAIGADYSSPAVSEQEGDLLQAYHNAGSADAINYKGKIIASKNITTKEYVDDKMAELLAKIEELEMAEAGALTNYSFRMYSDYFYSSGGIGNAMPSSSITTSSKSRESSDGIRWNGASTSAVEQRMRYVYVCFPDNTYQLNPQGGYTVVLSQSGSLIASETKVFSFLISGVEKCPEEYANNKNIWRAEQIPTEPKSGINQNLTSFQNGSYLFVTFNDGSVTKTAA